MCHIEPKKRLEILDILNQPWFKNEKLNEEDLKSIINKEEPKNKELKQNSNKKINNNKNPKINNKNINNLIIKEKENSFITLQRSNSLKFKNLENKKKFGTVKLHRDSSVRDMPTKINSNYNQESLFDVNMHLIRTNNGKISNHMLPIGMAKDQKRKTEIIKNLLNQCYDSVSPSYICTELATEVIKKKKVSKFSLAEDKKLSSNNQVKYLLYFLFTIFQIFLY
jgi:hypothetical protein